MSKKSHLYFRNPVEGKAIFRQKTRFSGSENDETQEKKSINVQAFKNSIALYTQGKSIRESNRNKSLNISLFIDYIEIEFYDTFASKDFTLRYRNDFGIYPVAFYQFNTIGLFAVVEQAVFVKFFAELNRIIASKNIKEETYNPDIRFIKSFRYFDVGIQTRSINEKSHCVLELIDNPELFQETVLPLEEQLKEYFIQKGIKYFPDIEHNRIELLDVSKDTIQEIANNFDIIQTVNAHDSGFIRPSLVGTPIRSFGFDIKMPVDNLPIVGVIDSGISNLTPLKDLTINQGNEFDITGTSPLEDACNHGTGVAALVAFGDKLYPAPGGIVEADAKLLSIKVTNSASTGLLNKDVIDLIRQANEKYGIKLFNLCVGYTDSKKENSLIDNYACLLDCLAYELDILIFISAGNHETIHCSFYNGKNFQQITYPEQFGLSSAIIKTPAESMNNITVGAASGNFERFDSARSISLDENAPAYYTCRHHVKAERKNYNKQLFKPDVIYYGGDYDNLLNCSDFGIRIMSSEIGKFYEREVGTSYSTPLLCNLAARLLNACPNLANNMQTVKALIINSASIQPFITKHIAKTKICKPGQLTGRGIPDTDKCIFSDDNNATLVLEESIMPDDLLVFPVHLPDFLQRLERQRVLTITATLCFRFNPRPNSHLAYCPIHIAFGIFRNLNIEEKEEKGEKFVDIGLNGNTTENIKLSSSAEAFWSEDYYYKSKPLSNTQKISFSVSKERLIAENGTFKIAVSSRFNKLLTEEERKSYNHAHPFSIVINIRENGNSGHLYDGLCAVNELEAINAVEAEAGVQLELFNEV
ncbi:MAG: S8 family serine peptidase [Dysgonamonadaceae bacterium]|jgi:hypothetical protein|nr:S8 family serine peptidase [Dysgonamonadaceae bacterium]